MNQALRPFPVQAILQQALQTPRHHLVSLFKLGWPFVIFMLFYHSPQLQQIRAMETPDKQLGEMLAPYAPYLLTGIILISLLLSNLNLYCYRKLILAEPTSWFKAFKIKRLLLPFLAKSLQIALAAFAVSFVLQIILSPMLKKLIDMDMVFLGQILFACPLYFFLSRWLLMLPANATGQHFGFNWSMQISKPYVWPIFLLNGLLPIIVQSLLHKIPTFDMWVMSIFVTILSVLIAVIQIALLALTYQFLTETSKKVDSIDNSEKSQQEKVNHDDPANKNDDLQQ
jgi:hypothetical protein